jgi:hypothetical protein
MIKAYTLISSTPWLNHDKLLTTHFYEMLKAYFPLPSFLNPTLVPKAIGNEGESTTASSPVMTAAEKSKLRKLAWKKQPTASNTNEATIVTDNKANEAAAAAATTTATTAAATEKNEEEEIIPMIYGLQLAEKFHFKTVNSEIIKILGLFSDNNIKDFQNELPSEIQRLVWYQLEKNSFFYSPDDIVEILEL